MASSDSDVVFCDFSRGKLTEVPSPPTPGVPLLFSVELGNLKGHLERLGLYQPDASADQRAGNAAAAKVMSKLPGIPPNVFVDQSRYEETLFNDLVGGSQLLADKLGAEKMTELGLDNNLGLKTIAAGEEWQSTTFPEYMFARMVVVLDGDTHFVAGIPLSVFRHD